MDYKESDFFKVDEKLVSRVTRRLYHCQLQKNLGFPLALPHASSLTPHGEK